MSYEIKNGQTSVILRVKLLDSSSTTGAGLTGLTSASSGLIIGTIADNEATTTAYTVAGSTIEAVTTLGTFAAPTATKCRFKEVDATNHKGIYELQIADARFAVSSAKSIIISILGATNLAQTDLIVKLVSDDPYVAKPTNSSLLSIDASGRVDIGKLLGTAWLTPGTAGTPDVNVKLWNALTTVALPLVPTTAGRTLDVSATGEAGLDWANVGSPTTSLALTGTTIAVTQKVDVDTIKTNPVVNGGTITFPTTATLASTTNITAGTVATATNVTTVNGLAANVITAASVADAAFDRATFAADTGLQTIRSNTAQAGASTTVTLDASASAIDDFYNSTDIVITGGTGVGQVRNLRDYVGATKVATIVPAWTTNPDNTSTFSIFPRTSPWDQLTADHLSTGSTGTAINAAGTAGDPWTTALPGSYGAGTAGKIVGDNINTTISSRASQTSVDVIDDYVDTEVAAIKAKTDQFVFTTANRVDSQVFGMQAGTVTAAAVATDAIDADALATDAVTEIQNGLSTLTAAGVRTAVGLASANLDTQLAALQADTDNIQTRLPTSLVSGRIDASVGAMAANTLTATAIAADAITDAKVASDVTIASVTGSVGSVTGAVGSVTAGVTLAASAVQAIWDAATSALTTAGSIGKLLVDNVNATISSRLSTAGYTAPDNTSITAIKTQTDKLTFTVANQVDSNVIDWKSSTAPAMTGDAYGLLNSAQTEPGQTTPTVNASPITKLALLYKAWRNKHTQTATDYNLFNDDAVTVDQKATVSDDGTTFTRGEIGSGP